MYTVDNLKNVALNSMLDNFMRIKILKERVLKRVLENFDTSLIYDLPPEIHSHILVNFKLSQAKTFLFTNKKTHEIVANNYHFWRKKYEGEIIGETLLVRSPSVFKEKLKIKFLNRDFVKNRIDETRTVICTDQADITQLSHVEGLLFCSSDDQTIKMYRNYRLESIFIGHKGGVWAFDVVGKYLVSGSTDKSIRIWDIESKTQLHVLTGHRSTIRCLRATPEYIISGSRDADIRVWNYYGECLHILRGHSLSVRCMDIYNNLLVTGSYDGTVILWDFIKGKKIKNLKSHTLRVYSVIINEDYIISGSQDNEIFVSNIQGEHLFVLKEHRSIVAWLKITKVDFVTYLYSSGADGCVIKWNLKNGEKIFKIIEISHITSIKIHNDLLVVARNDSVNLYNAKTAKLIRNLLSQSLLVYEVSFKNNCIVIAYKNISSTNLMILDYKKI